MTVTTPPADLRTQAARMALLGMHATASRFYTEAVDNVQAAVRGAQSTTDTASAATENALSRVQAVKGHDGAVISG